MMISSRRFLWLQPALELLESNQEIDEVRWTGGRPLLAFQYATLLSTTPAPDLSSRDFTQSVQELAFSQGLRLDPFEPSCGGLLSSNLRWHAIIPPVAEETLLILRRHRFDNLTLQSFVPSVQLTSLEESVYRKKNILICGPTGVGKTSLLAALLGGIQPNERVLVLEDYRELPLKTQTWNRLTSRQALSDGKGRFAIMDLVDMTLRLSPDRLVFGELRRHSLAGFLEAASTGTTGLLGTFHAGSPSQALTRIEAASHHSLNSTPISLAFLTRQLNEHHLPQVFNLTELGGG